MSQFSLQVISYVAINILAGLLILGWLSMAIFYRWGICLGQSGNRRSTPKMKGTL